MATSGLMSVVMAFTAVAGFISQSTEIPKSEGAQKTFTQASNIAVEVQGSDMLKTIVPILQSWRANQSNPQPYNPQPITPI